jgi:hypothetical protein
MHLANLDFFLWAAALTQHIILFGVLWIRHRARQFPIFTAFIAANILRTVALYFTYRHGSDNAYFFTYWSLAILDTAFQLAIIYEIASDVFRPLGEWAIDVRQKLLWWILGSVVVAAALTWLAAPPAHSWRSVVVIRGDFFTEALLGQLFVGMVVLSVTIGLPWKTHVARIAQGLGAYSILCILIDAGDNYFGVARGKQTYIMLSHVRMTMYSLCLAYWTVTLWLSAPSPKEIPDRMRRQLASLQLQTASDLYRIRSWRKQ